MKNVPLKVLKKAERESARELKNKQKKPENKKKLEYKQKPKNERDKENPKHLKL
jgi:hypothetical protein